MGFARSNAPYLFWGRTQTHTHIVTKTRVSNNSKKTRAARNNPGEKNTAGRKKTHHF